jgi:hypothetical protein
MRLNLARPFPGLVLVLGVLALSRLQAQESAESVVQKMVERDKELVRNRAVYTYTVDETRQKLDPVGKVVSSSEEEEQIQGAPSPPKITPDNQDIETTLKQTAKEEPFNILKIISHYHYTLAGNEVVNDLPCIKIKFSPKDNQPYRNRDEKVANEIEGYLWITETDYTLARNSGKLTKPVSVAWFFATLQEMEFQFETKPLPNGDLGPSMVEYKFRVQIPFAQIYERHIRVTKDYRETIRAP